MNDVLIDYFKSLNSSNKLGHAFLICNTTLNDLEKSIEEILSDYFFNSKVNIYENNDIHIIRPNNSKILKEDILLLQENFMKTSQINENRVYIIDQTEKMNDFACNSLLKFLEEPEKNIYAFLISSNVNKVLPTIKSRCQIIMINNDSTFNILDYDNDLINKAISIVDLFESKGVSSLAFIYDFLEKKEDKENVSNIIRIMKYFYMEILNFMISNKNLIFSDFTNIIEKIAIKNSVKSIVNKLTILNNNENMLEYNMNLSLFFDKLFIEMEMKSNE